MRLKYGENDIMAKKRLSNEFSKFFEIFFGTFADYFCLNNRLSQLYSIKDGS